MKTMWLSLVFIAVFISSFCGNAYGQYYYRPPSYENGDLTFTYRFVGGWGQPNHQARYVFKTPLVSVKGSGYYGTFYQYRANVLIGFTDGSSCYIPKGMIETGYVAPAGKKIAFVEFNNSGNDPTATISSGVYDLIRCDEATDSDNDGLSNLAEFSALTEYFNPDTDGDTVKDGQDNNPLVFQTWYRMEALPETSTANFWVTAINNHGTVVGYGTTPEGMRSFLLKDGVAIPLGTLNGGATFANDVNDLDQVVGTSSDRAFLYSEGIMTDLGTAGAMTAEAIDINNQGQVLVNSSRWSYGPINRRTGTRSKTYYDYCHLWQNGVFTSLGSLGGTMTRGYSLNEAGQVVGSGLPLGGGTMHPFLYTPGVGIQDRLGQTGCLWLEDINDHGEMIGWAGTARFFDGEQFVWERNLGTDTFGRSLNNHAQIVGVGTSLGDYQQRGWVCGETDPALQDLNTVLHPDDQQAWAGWVITEADDINDQGWIVGIMIHPVQGRKAILLKPAVP